MNGFERLKSMLDEWLKNHPNNEAFQQTINYLLQRDDLEPKYLNEEKNLDQLYQFIRNRASKHLQDGWGYITNEVVYSWGVMYFSFPNTFLKINTPISNTKNTTKSNKTNIKNNVVSIEKAKKSIEEKKQLEQLTLFGGAAQ